ncbi:hypothetical protein Tco_0878226 [Tanacetum coccineum]|uniref:Uncharacterized protein n=1 Tax=Tanacetum coccineum TaxID=301880 RepID=A0ABQ5BXF8_9ASTR
MHQRWEHHKSNHQPRLPLDLLHLHHSCSDTHVLKYRGVQMRHSAADLISAERLLSLNISEDIVIDATNKGDTTRLLNHLMGTPQKQPSTPFAIGSAAPASFLFGYACSRMPGFEGDGI